MEQRKLLLRMPQDGPCNPIAKAEFAKVKAP